MRKDSVEEVRKGLIILNLTLDHATLQGLIEHNPARLLKSAMFGASMGEPHERWLPQDELHMLWKALNEASVGGGSVAAGGRGIASSVVMSLSVANALRLIIFIGVRRSEAAEMRWDQINGDALTRALERVRSKYLAELAPFPPHDLRRSVATGCAEYLDAPERLIELLLNHVPRERLIRTYQVRATSGQTEKAISTLE